MHLRRPSNDAAVRSCGRATEVLRAGTNVACGSRRLGVVQLRVRDDDATQVIARGDRDDLVLGRYRLLERVGTGGTADVWRARDERRDRTVTVKILRERDDPEMRASFLEEARLLDALAHPGSIPVLEIQDACDVTLIAFEHVEGETLASIERTRGPLPAREVGVILLQLASVLEALHRQGFAHLDVKPANVLLERSGTVRLIDFGIAQRIGERPAVIRGTPRYLAPEVRSGAPVTNSSDVYGLALVARDLLGERPGAPRTAALVRRALDPEPRRRPRSPRSFALAFAAMALLEGEIATVRRALAWSAARLPLRGTNRRSMLPYALIAALVAGLLMALAA